MTIKTALKHVNVNAKQKCQCKLSLLVLFILWPSLSTNRIGETLTTCAQSNKDILSVFLRYAQFKQFGWLCLIFFQPIRALKTSLAFSATRKYMETYDVGSSDIASSYSWNNWNYCNGTVVLARLLLSWMTIRVFWSNTISWSQFLKELGKGKMLKVKINA